MSFVFSRPSLGESLSPQSAARVRAAMEHGYAVRAAREARAAAGGPDRAVVADSQAILAWVDSPAGAAHGLETYPVPGVSGVADLTGLSAEEQRLYRMAWGDR